MDEKYTRDFSVQGQSNNVGRFMVNAAFTAGSALEKVVKLNIISEKCEQDNIAGHYIVEYPLREGGEIVLTFILPRSTTDISFSFYVSLPKNKLTEEEFDAFCNEFAHLLGLLDYDIWIAKENTETNDGGCYIATAVYGSYDCPQVWTLRRYRDQGLAATPWGRAFIRTYYATSPLLVCWFGNTAWFNRLLRPKLDAMVRKLQRKGYASTPYSDRRWA